MRICVLASSSAANCTLIDTGQTRILIDAGLSARETERRLSELGLGLDDIAAVCISHEHSDHVAGLRVMHSRHGVALYANSGTAEAIQRMPRHDAMHWNIFANGQPFTIGDLRVEPFSVPHDAYDPVGFILTHNTCGVGVVTDMGIATELIRQRLRTCRCLVLESNYDDDLLRDSPRPWSLKQRIMGHQGHLSNAHARALVEAIASDTLERVYLAHLSNDCNHPDQALANMRAGVAASTNPRIDVQLTFRDRVSAPWSPLAAGTIPNGAGHSAARIGPLDGTDP